MKNLKNFNINNLIFVIIACFVFAACKKSSPSVSISGTWTASTYSYKHNDPGNASNSVNVELTKTGTLTFTDAKNVSWAVDADSYLLLSGTGSGTYTGPSSSGGSQFIYISRSGGGVFTFQVSTLTAHSLVLENHLVENSVSTDIVCKFTR